MVLKPTQGNNLSAIFFFQESVTQSSNFKLTFNQIFSFFFQILLYIFLSIFKTWWTIGTYSVDFWNRSRTNVIKMEINIENCANNILLRVL